MLKESKLPTDDRTITDKFFETESVAVLSSVGK